MALDLGERLLPAFETPTGIPFHTINLRHGVSREVSQTRETCTAAAGTLLLELGLLSRLTGDARFEQGAPARRLDPSRGPRCSHASPAIRWRRARRSPPLRAPADTPPQPPAVLWGRFGSAAASST